MDNFYSGPREFAQNRICYEGDIADKALIKEIANEHSGIYATIHCAARIIVPESVMDPEAYYRENVAKSLELFASLRDVGCKNIVFSSSAAIYDLVDGFMVHEESVLKPSSPYARTKYMMEMVLQDFCSAYDLRGIALRYFNPIGAEPKLRSGPYAKNPSHVLGKLISLASGNLDCFEITGTDWPTRDGSGIRDYIHIWDLARAHVLAVENFESVFSDSSMRETASKKYQAINLGTGRGVTVKEFVSAFERVLGREINKREAPARPGDVAGSFANADTAQRLIGWRAELSIEDGIAHALQWMKSYENKKK